MSIKIKNLNKVYGTQHALKDVSFSVQPGELLGFLGPNGAGKSTTMKIATGYLLPTSGEVAVAGIDMLQNPLEGRKKIGYLPEHNPLYLDMYVKEFLQLAGSVSGIKGNQLKQRMAEMLSMCGLEREQHKKIGSLSKGYRQRVGLAQALIHDPEVLILDEPTTGLDPNQIVEIRKLIKQVSEQKTVIFSSHIMQEVEAVCERVIIIDKGQIVADNKVTQLTKASDERFIIHAEFAAAVAEDLLAGLADVQAVKRVGEHKYLIEASSDLRKQLFKLAAEKDLSLIGLQLEEGSLEQVFHKLTKQ
jgi:ABC-2 type transport system ATP-binding protein